MLTYLIKVTEALLMTAVILGIIAAYTYQKRSSRPKVIAMLAAMAGGTAASVVMAYMKNATNKIDTGMWNLRIFSVSIAAFLVFLILSAFAKKAAVLEWISWIALCVIAFAAILYAFPDVWAFPWGFVGAGQSVLSTEFLYKLIGYVLALILMLVAGIAVYKLHIRAEGLTGVILRIVLLINALRQASSCLSIMLAKRMIQSNHELFLIAKFTSNHSTLFIYCVLIAALVVPAVLLVRSFRVNEPYANPAEHRKIRAKWHFTRRWIAASVICVALAVSNLTVVKAMDSGEVELSPVEEAQTDDENVYVPFEQVEDGHLHRFGYVTENGVQIRFIVIKKPNSSAYGIGLDACDICGETGYYEKDGQVVCKLCDVVMNISTIGFKGGCNPIVIDYRIENGKIVVPIETLAAHESIFK